MSFPCTFLQQCFFIVTCIFRYIVNYLCMCAKCGNNMLATFKPCLITLDKELIGEKFKLLFYLIFTETRDKRACFHSPL